MSVITEPWNEVGWERRPITPLPGLTPNAIEGLKASFPGTLNRSLEELLECTCGIEGTALGSLDFTGQWHGQEPLAVFRPCLTLAIDDQGRRWIAEGATDDGLPGPVWCDCWLKALSLEARVVQRASRRRSLVTTSIRDCVEFSHCATGRAGLGARKTAVEAVDA